MAQNEPFSDIAKEAATIIVQCLDRLHTYLFFMGSKYEFESFQTQILNTSLLPSLYEAFAIIEGDECQLRLIQTSPTLPSDPSPGSDHMPFAARTGPRSGGRKPPICTHYNVVGHTKDRCFQLHPELKKQFAKSCATGPPRLVAIAETESD